MIMKRATWQVGRVIAVAAGVGLFLAHAVESPPELPGAIADLIHKTFPEAEIVHAKRETDHDDSTYKVRLKKVADGRRIGVEIGAAPGITRIEEELNPDDLPPKVQRALQKAFPNAPMAQAQKESEIRVAYEIDVFVGGKRREIRISPRGKILDVD
jgi:hypothetical protein